MMSMTPEEKERLAVHIKEIAKILYKNTPPEKIETFEGIEYSVREQVLEHFFCRRKDRNNERVYPKNKKLYWSNFYHFYSSISFGNWAVSTTKPHVIQVLFATCSQ